MINDMAIINDLLLNSLQEKEERKNKQNELNSIKKWNKNQINSNRFLNNNNNKETSLYSHHQTKIIEDIK